VVLEAELILSLSTASPDFQEWTFLESASWLEVHAVIHECVHPPENGCSALGADQGKAEWQAERKVPAKRT
jgi:hypothetical protein